MTGWTPVVDYWPKMSPNVGAPPHLVSLRPPDCLPVVAGLVVVDTATAVTCGLIQRLGLAGWLAGRRWLLIGGKCPPMWGRPHTWCHLDHQIASQ